MRSPASIVPLTREDDKKKGISTTLKKQVEYKRKHLVFQLMGSPASIVTLTREDDNKKWLRHLSFPRTK
jgi:hypothetical protein